MSWNPEQYLKYSQPRLRPALDLLARIDPGAPRVVCDLGCGAGNVTALLAARWPAAELTGVDDSASMLAKARQEQPRVRWQQADIRDWRPERPPDVLFSNAALHWLPDHARLFPALMQRLAPGGVLAVQMPRNFAAASHTAVAATAQEQARWHKTLAPMLGPAPVAAPDRYFDWLDPQAAELDIWETEYLQVLEGEDPVKEWTKGTWLRQFLDALGPGEAPAFERAYAARLRQSYPARVDGRTLFPFRRLFIVARRRA